MAIDKDPITRIMERSPLFEGINRNVLHLLYDEIQPVVERYTRGEVIVEEGDEEREIGIVINGSLFGEKFHSEGDVHLVKVYEPGDIFSLNSVVSRSRIAPISISASNDCEILALVGEKLKNCRAGGMIQQNIIRILADENIRNLYKVDILSHNGLRDRVLIYLQIMAQKHHSNSFHIMMTQEQFAQYLSVNRSALSNELNKMRREGIIDFKKDRFVLLRRV